MADKTKKGTVYIVGAGPGDPGLISMRGVECLGRADVVVFDYLVNASLLDYAPKGSERIYVGKVGGSHTLPQEKINELLVEKARAGLCVVRLKGGDPYVYGRGGEEALVLHEAGIQFEVIPGITSAIAAPAYAGIPVTHREHTSSLAIITGHEDPIKEGSNLDWSALARMGTLVILMGVGRLEENINALTSSGKSPDTPIALVRWGTTGKQQKLIGTLSDIVAKVKEAGFSAPAIAVIGDVVRLHEKLNWYERKPLFGKTVLVTRSRGQASVLSQLLREAGGDPIECPTIEFRRPAELSALDDSISKLDRYDWIIFTSSNGVDFFFERLGELGQDVRALKGIKLCAMGDATAGALSRYGLRVDLVPKEFKAEGVIEALKSFTDGQIVGVRFLIPRALVAREVLPFELEKMGALVDVAPSYETVVPSGSQVAQVKEMLLDGQISYVTFSSSSTVINFMQMLRIEKDQKGLEEAKRIFSKTKIACIGPITKDTVQEYGLVVSVMPSTYTIPALVEALIEAQNP